MPNNIRAVIFILGIWVRTCCGDCT